MDCKRLLGIALLVTVTGTSRSLDNTYEEAKPSQESLSEETIVAGRPSYTPCELSVDNKSAEYFKNVMQAYESNYVRFRVSFPKHITYSVRPGVVSANWMFWTYYSASQYFPYLKWPIDFSILSFGGLDAKTLPVQMKMFFQATHNNCSIVMGDLHTRLAIGKALMTFTKQYLYDLASKQLTYSDSYWCNLEEKKGVRKTFLYQLARHVGFLVNDVQYSCCRTNLTSKHLWNVKCLSQIPQSQKNVVIPNIVGVLAFLLSPFIGLRLSAALIRKTHDVEDSGYVRVSLAAGSETQEASGLGGGWVFLTNSAPISMTSLLSGVCGLQNRFPVATSRIRRACILIVFPVVVYVQLYVYSRYQPDLTLQRIQQHLPTRFLSLLGGIRQSVGAFCPFLGGPFCLLLGYHMLGFVFMLLPRSLDNFFESATSSSQQSGSSPLLFSMIEIEKLSSIAISTKHGYERLYRQCVGRFFMLFNPTFWCTALQSQVDRARKYYRNIPKPLPKYVLIGLFAVLAPLYIAICALEDLVCVPYYGLPMIEVMKVIVKGFFINLRRRLSSSQSQQPLNKYVINPLLILLTVTIILSFLYFLLGFWIILICSFIVVGQLLTFSLIAVIIYPSTSFGYLFFGVVLMYYIFKQLQGFGSGYHELLGDAVENSLVLQTMRTDRQESIINNDTSPSASCINDCSHEHSPVSEQVQATGVRNSSAAVEMTAYRAHEVGIPYPLFTTLVKQYHPVHVQVAKAFIKIGFIVALIALTIALTTRSGKAQTQPEGFGEVMHIIFIMAVGALPRILEIAFSNQNRALSKEIRSRKIRASIVKYWQELSEAEFQNMDIV